MSIKTEGLAPEQIEKLKAMQEEMLAENSKPISRYHLEEGWYQDGMVMAYVKRPTWDKVGRLRLTQEEALSEFNAWQCRLRLLKRIAELNEGWEPDFARGWQENYYFTSWPRGIDVDCCDQIQTLHKDFYFKSKEIGKKLLKEFAQDKIKAAMWGCV